jgi:UDPglucose--hexose-1-phosphate uridylyltransferase
VMGLAVLPGRLKDELDQAAELLTGQTTLDDRITHHPEHPLHKHTAWLEELIAGYGRSMSAEAAQQLLRDEVGRKFSDVLRDAGVYKCTERGRDGFRTFLRDMGFR